LLAEAPPYLAYIYNYCDTKIVLLRDYAPAYPDVSDEIAVADTVNYLRALLYDQAPHVDGLVLDHVYPDDRFVEDHGVSPDVEYSHTLEDFRAGYVGYVHAFSDAIVEAVHGK